MNKSKKASKSVFYPTLKDSILLVGGRRDVGKSCDFHQSPAGLGRWQVSARERDREKEVEMEQRTTP